MKSECQSAVETALGRELKPGEADQIDREVNLQMRLAGRGDPDAWAARTPEERLKVGADRTAAKMLSDLKLAGNRIRLQIAAHDRVDNALNDRLEERDQLNLKTKPGELLRDVSNTLAFDARGHGFMSAETWGKSIAQEAFGQLMPLWTSIKGFAGLFENEAGINALQHEFYGEDSGNAAAKAGVAIWKKITSGFLDRGNAAGMNIGFLEDWGKPQAWSQHLIAQVTPDRFAADMLPHFDRDMYIHDDGTRMTDAEMTEMLTRSHDTITTDGQNTNKPGAPTGIGMLANRNSAHRAFFFKSADDFLAAQGKYGEGTLWPTLVRHIQTMGRDIGLVETHGPNAARQYQYFLDRALLQELRLNPGAKSKIMAQYKLYQSMFDYAAGSRDVVNQKIADIGQTFRNYEVATKLGGVAITALGDEAGMAATAFANRIPWTETFARQMHYLNPANGEDRAIANHAALGINSIIGGLQRFSMEDLNLDSGEGKTGAMRQFTAKLSQAVLKLGGAEGMWDGRRKGLGSVLMSYLGKRVGEVEHFADINPTDHGVLAHKGITETDWQVWRAAEGEDWGMKYPVLTPKAVWAIDDAKLKDAIAKNVPGVDPDKIDTVALKRHAATALLGHTLEEVGMGVMDTGVRERARMAFGTQAGTIGGELVRSGMLFKGFSASMMMKHWARAGDMPTGADTASYVARLVTMGLITGAVALQLRALYSGQNPRNIAEPGFWGDALLRSGGLGFYGDFLYSEMTSHDTTLTPALMGPLATEAEEVWNLTGGNAFKHARGERTDELAKLIRFGRGDIPVLNMWYTKAALDHLVWNDMQEAVSPGYLGRMENRAFINRGTTYYWDPGEHLPSAVPDASKVWQPGLGAEQIERLKQQTGLQ